MFDRFNFIPISQELIDSSSFTWVSCHDFFRNHDYSFFLPIIKHYTFFAKPFQNSYLYACNLCFDKKFDINCSLRGRKEIQIINNVSSNHLGKIYTRFNFTIQQSTLLISSWNQHVASKVLEDLYLYLIEHSWEVLPPILWFYTHWNSSQSKIE